MCDTYVSLSNWSKNQNVIFGKNSDRNESEVQLITYTPRKTYSHGDEVRCTHISIPHVKESAAVILSQPYWMWGAEMGANEYNVVIGNESIQTREPLKDIGLTGMDLLRLGLERGKTAKEALKVIIDLLENYGQGGSHSLTQYNYHNSYLIADPTEAYVLETAGDWWIAEIVRDFRSISNHISVRFKGDMRRKGIIQHAIEKGYCKDDNDFDFKMTFSRVPLPEQFPITDRDGFSLHQLSSNKGTITVPKMMNFLRDHEVEICRHLRKDQSVGSQVSLLRKDNKKSIHWFTGSTIPCLSIYKPYVFPVDAQKVMESKPYSSIDPIWFWSRHFDFINFYKKRPKRDIPERNEYYGKLRAVENDLIDQIDDIISKEENISDHEFTELIKKVNSYGWEKSEELIK
ncbi:MAG: C69 family dipeptidase [Candidatus Hermodarchaeota archaeon]